MSTNSLRSFAFGMIFTTAIFSIFYYLQPAQTENEIVPTNAKIEETLQQYLNEKGYMLIAKDTYDELITEEAAEKKESKSPTQQNTEQTENEQKQQNKDTKTYIITIQTGMTSYEVANLLEQYGIITDSQKFESFLKENGWSRSIQIGQYELNSSMSYEEIGKVITKQ